MKEKKGRRLRWEEVKKEKLIHKGEAPFLWVLKSTRIETKRVVKGTMTLAMVVFKGQTITALFLIIQITLDGQWRHHTQAMTIN